MNAMRLPKLLCCMLLIVTLSCSHSNIVVCEVCGIGLEDNYQKAQISLKDYAKANPGNITLMDDKIVYVNHNDTVTVLFENGHTKLIDIRTKPHKHMDDAIIRHGIEYLSLFDCIDTVINEQIHILNDGKGWLRIEKLNELKYENL